MCSEQKFYICKHCGNLIGMINNKGVPLVCCGEKMTELEANTVDASKEKHLPVVKIDGNTVTVTVGSTAHPMEEAHHIEFVYIETKNGGQRKCPVTEPKVKFSIIDDELIAVFAYCNLHGLWKTEIKA